ncbi:ribosomal protein L7/L12 [uncultured Microscilla sp.]|uniref:ribosomal protein L7/L12 n=1 Tax=uncultured Microscilla sp. TaxID=432653 RepID=UPI0026338226|nr:ribosomal protein L7/L12 [uncultured Microscilla sp.]
MKEIEYQIIQYLLDNKSTEAVSVAFESLGAMSEAKALVTQITNQLTARWDNIPLLKQVLQDLQTLGKGKAIIHARAHYFDNLGIAKKYVEAVAEYFQLPLSNCIDDDCLSTQVQELISQGKKIQAIKLVKEHTGWGLKESKAYIDQVNALLTTSYLTQNQ